MKLAPFSGAIGPALDCVMLEIAFIIGFINFGLLSGPEELILLVFSSQRS